MKLAHSLLFFSISLLLLLPRPSQAEEQRKMEKYFYYSTNLANDKKIVKLEEIWRRAAKAGYTKVVLDDYRFGLIDFMPKSYFENIKKVQHLAQQLNIEIIPCIFPIGYSAAILAHDPNLVEAVPVKDAPYVVRGGIARLEKNDVSLKNGDFKSFDGWVADKGIINDDGSARVTQGASNTQILQKIKLHPFRQYHFSLDIKSKNFSNAAPVVEIRVGENIRHGLILNKYPKVLSTQGWKRYDFIFNSLNYSDADIDLYIDGNNQRGDLWWGKTALEEVDFINMVRRGGAPLMIETEEGRKLIEGKDFDRLTDPMLGSNDWRETYYSSPVLKVHLPDGTRLKVSYEHVVLGPNGHVMVCLSENKTYEILKKLFSRIHKAFQARSYFFSHDEIRTMGWDKSCEMRGLTNGQILADNFKKCEGIVKERCPNCAIYVWSDMFDPFHNALKEDEYLNKSQWTDSWAGLTPDVIIANWNEFQREKSLRFFFNKGHRQIIAGYYDEPLENMLEWLKAIPPEGKSTITGIMYTTWKDQYDDLEQFSALADQWSSGN